MNIEKERLPKGLTYPLKSSLFERELASAGITTHVSLLYGSRHVLFEAFYWLPNKNVDYDRFYIRTGSVDSSDSKRAKEYLECSVIPDFIDWARDIVLLPTDSTRLNDTLYFSKNL